MRACGHVFESLCTHTHTAGNLRRPQHLVRPHFTFVSKLETGRRRTSVAFSFTGSCFRRSTRRSSGPRPFFENTLPILEKARAHSCASHVFRSVRIRVLRAGEQVVLRSSAELATRRSWWPKWPLPYELGQADILSISYRIILILVRS